MMPSPAQSFGWRCLGCHGFSPQSGLGARPTGSPSMANSWPISGTQTRGQVRLAEPGTWASSGVRRITRQESKYVSHMAFQVMTLTTQSGDVEIAADAGTVQKIRDVVIPAPTTE